MDPKFENQRCVSTLKGQPKYPELDVRLREWVEERLHNYGDKELGYQIVKKNAIKIARSMGIKVV